jgi:hypothetical protein
MSNRSSTQQSLGRTETVYYVRSAPARLLTHLQQIFGDLSQPEDWAHNYCDYFK